LNKNDQDKVLTFLNEHADDEVKKENVQKVSNLVNNMNGIKSYIKGLIKKRVNIDKEKSELEKDKLDDLTKIVTNNLFEDAKKETEQKDKKVEEAPEEGVYTPVKTEEKIDNVVDTLNKLHENDTEKVLNALEQNAKDDKKQKTLSKLRQKVRKVNQLNILVNNMKKNTKAYEKLTEEEINEIAYNFSHDLYYKDKEPTGSLENLIMNENKENKIDDLAESIKKLDKSDQDKALEIISNNAVNDEEKEKANKLSNLVKNIKNMKSYFGKMIKVQLKKDKDKNEDKEDKDKDKGTSHLQPMQGDLNEDEVAKIVDSFWTDLKNSGKDKEKTNDIINNFANIVKEFKPVDQQKAIRILKDKTQKENSNVEDIQNLEKKINDLNKMKNEIESYKNNIIINKKSHPLINKRKKENKLITIPPEDNNDIIIQELEPAKLQQLSNNLIADLNDEEKPSEVSPSIKMRGRAKKKMLMIIRLMISPM
jgi:hypothetical protein